MDIHRRAGVLDWILRKIDSDSAISDKDRRLIREFDYSNIERGLSLATRSFYLCNVYRMALMFGKSFHEVERGDIPRVLSHIDGNGFSERTRESYRRTMRKFFTWMGLADHVRGVKVMTSTQLYANSIPETILDKSEQRDIIRSGRNLFEKALLAVLIESGARVGEILQLRVRSVLFDRVGAKLILPREGKTGKRVVRLVSCRCGHPMLATNLLREQAAGKKEYVFERRNHLAHRIQGTKYQYVRHLFERLRAAGITDKRLHAHLFRHTRATQVSAWCSYSALCDYFGWRYGSKMPSIYLRANGIGLDNQLLKGYGMKPVRPESLCIWH